MDRWMTHCDHGDRSWHVWKRTLNAPKATEPKSPFFSTNCAQRVLVLNARRHRNRNHSLNEQPQACNAECSTPEGIGIEITSARGTWTRYRDRSAQRPKASESKSPRWSLRSAARTASAQRPKASESKSLRVDGAQTPKRSCAQRPKASESKSLNINLTEGTATLMCSTPEGIGIEITVETGPVDIVVSRAQRPKASESKSPGRRGFGQRLL